MSKKIGVFDSGIGGFTVLKELKNVIDAEYVYIGDTARAPYGNKNREELLRCTEDLLTFLKKKEVSLFVSACNSLSTLDVEPILEKLSIEKTHYFDMTMFGEMAASRLDKKANLLIYATRATVESGVYQNVFKDVVSHVLISSHLAQAIEEGHEIEIDEEIDILLDYVLEHGITHIFLGCTHYPLVEEYIDKRFLDTGVTFINPAKYVGELFELNKNSDQKVTIFLTKVTPQGENLSKEMFDTHPAYTQL